MSFFEKMKLARENKDHIAFGELLSESYTFVRHQTGTTMNKEEELLIGACDNGIDIDLEAFEKAKLESDALMISHSNDENIAQNQEAHTWAKIKHDGKPETSTATVILDAGGSYDPNKVDKLIFEWKQISGKTVYLEPNPSSPRVAFNAGPGEYKFEITLTDGYGTLIKDTKIVHVLEESNDLPVLETRVLAK